MKKKYKTPPIAVGRVSFAAIDCRGDNLLKIIINATPLQPSRCRGVAVASLPRHEIDHINRHGLTDDRRSLETVQVLP